MGQITIDEMHKSLFDYAQAVSDENLITESKTIVDAINEIYGKRLIANAIGEPLNSTDTYAKMNNDINGLLSTFKTNMMNNGVTVESGDKFKSLIDKIATMMEEGEGKGIQYITGTGVPSSDKVAFISKGSDYNCKYIDLTFDFEPNIILVTPTKGSTNSGTINIYIKELGYVYISTYQMIATTNFTVGITIDSKVKKGNGKYRMPLYPNMSGNIIWAAIGIGEEDTTLRDSLASVLEDEGVDVTEEDNMASLISKTDNEFQENTTILYNKMKDANYNVDSSMNMDALLNELTFKTIIEGKVAQSPSTSENSLVYSVSGLDFTPSLVYVTLGGVYEQSDVIESVYYKSIILNNRQSFVGASEYNTIEVNIKNNGFNLILNSQDGGTYTGLGWTSINGISYVAIR